MYHPVIFFCFRRARAQNSSLSRCRTTGFRGFQQFKGLFSEHLSVNVGYILTYLDSVFIAKAGKHGVPRLRVQVDDIRHIRDS